MAESFKKVTTLKRRIILCEACSGKIDKVPKAKYIAFGSGGVDSSENPKQPTETQTSLNEELKRYEIKEVEYPEPTTARYHVSIPLDELAGAKINEAGLIDEKDNLCAINTFYTKRKDDGVEFKFTFDDEF